MKRFVNQIINLSLVVFILRAIDGDLTGIEYMVAGLLASINTSLYFIASDIEAVRKHTRVLALTVALKEVKNNPDLRDKLKKKLFDNSV
jgi:hypothetical protein